MYVLLGTCPVDASQNVGDALLTDSAKRMLHREKGVDEFRVFFRETDLTEHLDVVNASRAVVMPGFAIRAGMYPRLYRLVENLDRIKVPLIPLGAGWSQFPGDRHQTRTFRYDAETAEFLRYMGGQVSEFACREYSTCRMLKYHDVRNTRMVGDCGWYDLDLLGKPMKRPRQIDRLVFTLPHRASCIPQVKLLLDMLAALFPDAERWCALHSVPNEADRAILAHAETLGYRVRDLRLESSRLSFYDSIDLHVGYRCHGHISFLRRRIPSVLIAEDSRGLGFSHTLGMGGFPAFSREFFAPASVLRSSASQTVRLAGERVAAMIEKKKPSETSVARPSAALNPLAYLDMSVAETVREFLEEELDSGFRRYLGLFEFIDETYEKEMREFLRSIP